MRVIEIEARRLRDSLEELQLSSYRNWEPERLTEKERTMLNDYDRSALIMKEFMPYITAAFILSTPSPDLPILAPLDNLCNNNKTDCPKYTNNIYEPLPLLESLPYISVEFPTDDLDASYETEGASPENNVSYETEEAELADLADLADPFYETEGAEPVYETVAEEPAQEAVEVEPTEKAQENDGTEGIDQAEEAEEADERSERSERNEGTEVEEAERREDEDAEAALAFPDITEAVSECLTWKDIENFYSETSIVRFLQQVNGSAKIYFDHDYNPVLAVKSQKGTYQYVYELSEYAFRDNLDSILNNRVVEELQTLVEDLEN
jgi:hypothetical protein